MAPIEDNPFYQVIKSDKLTDAGKTAAVEGMLASPGTDTLQEFREYQQFLRAERKRLSAEIINSTDIPALKELTSTLDDLSKGLEDFNKNMQPLTDVIQQMLDRREGKTTGPAVAAAPPELIFDGALDRAMTVRRPLSLKTRYIMMRL